MTNAVICAYARSPFTPANKGALVEIRPDDLAAQVVKGLLAKTSLSPSEIEDVICGCAFPEGEQGFNIGRQIVFLSGLPHSVAGATVNRWCGSSMEAIHIAAGKIATGAGEVFIAVGVESMTRIPIGGFNPMPNPELYETLPTAYMNMGETAEEVAKLHNITRKEMEEFALKSHQKATAADFADEIIGISGDNKISADGCVRGDASLEKMASLAPAFRADGAVTAATSSPLTDGAAAVIVASEAAAKRLGLPILARIKSSATSGLEPEIMGMGPVEAARKALARAGLKVSDIDIFEINEAFAAQAIPVARELGIPLEKLNMDGGAIALGHPLGASGARITGKAAQLLHKHGKQYALAAMCIGGGMGIATVLEKAGRFDGYFIIFPRFR
jgi:acetyl-CoA acyltransferase